MNILTAPNFETSQTGVVKLGWRLRPIGLIEKSA